ncbi:MAG: metallophosphoesterase [FCB group bacterium]|nr:metallophosphoesterase [FCB group bacterium]
MTELYPVFFAAIMFLVLSGLVILYLKYLNRRWWNMRVVKRSSYILPLGGLVFISIWVAGVFSYKKTIMYIGATLTALDLVLIMALLLSLPISGIINFIHDRLEKRKKVQEKSGPPQNVLPRRRFLKTAAAVVPVAAMTSGASGVAHAFADVKIYKTEIYFDDLPEALDGFKILHLSDIHIGYYFWLDMLEEVLKRSQAFEPDIVLATGDLCDRVDIYSDLLDILERYKGKLGVFASIGNHEYFRGIREVRRAYDNSPVSLLLDTGATVVHNDQTIYIGGADDPRFMHGSILAFLKKTTETAMRNATKDAFSILLSHRPRAFDIASEIGVDLTLSGHTHGGQIGFAGRSAFEPWFAEAYLWGHYSKRQSRLYTSSGIGHWFPFRLGCPAEAPILELRRGGKRHS